MIFLQFIFTLLNSLFKTLTSYDGAYTQSELLIYYEMSLLNIIAVKSLLS